MNYKLANQNPVENNNPVETDIDVAIIINL